MTQVYKEKDSKQINNRLFSKEDLEKEFGVKQEYEWTTTESFGKEHIRAKYYVEIGEAGREYINLYDVEIESWYED